MKAKPQETEKRANNWMQNCVELVNMNGKEATIRIANSVTAYEKGIEQGRASALRDVEAIRLKKYSAGYEQGKFDMIMDIFRLIDECKQYYNDGMHQIEIKELKQSLSHLNNPPVADESIPTLQDSLSREGNTHKELRAKVDARKGCGKIFEDMSIDYVCGREYNSFGSIAFCPSCQKQEKK